MGHMDTTTAAPPTRYRIIGVIERWYQPAPDASKRPGGSCWHCGTGIAICVQIRHDATGEVHEIGTTCAERVGVDAGEMKKMLAEKFAEDRRLRSAEYRRQAAEHDWHEFVKWCDEIAEQAEGWADRLDPDRVFDRSYHITRQLDQIAKGARAARTYHEAGDSR